MKIKILVTLTFALFTLSVISAETTIPGGNVSGTWQKANSPYNITGDITIPVNNTLIIEPGVHVNFQGYYSLTVNGLLEALGTVTDSIHFFPQNTGIYDERWAGISFINAPDSSHLVFCTISLSGNFLSGSGGITCSNSNPVIRNCRISDNQSHQEIATFGGGIVLNNSNAAISHCKITNNKSGYCGGGINIYNSNPKINGCNISGNESLTYGGGIYITGTSSPMIASCTIEGNESNWEGGGIYCAGGVINFLECTIGYNESYLSGGGIYSAGGSVSLNRCTIERNQCSNFAAQGGGIFATGGTIVVDHCTFYGGYVPNWDNYGMVIHTGGSVAMTVTNSIFLNDMNLIVFNSTTPASVSYNDFKSYFLQIFSGNIPAGLGQLTTTNANGDPCDVYYNIFLDPLFEDPGSGNYQITWANWPNPDSTKSPCIDAGDPEFASDRDSTIADIGRYFFDQSVPEISFSSSILNFETVLIGEKADTILRIYNTGLDTLLIHQLFNDEAVFSTDYNAADNIILPGDSISITVTFTPVDTVPVIDTIHIYNNDQDSIVKLTGTGQLPSVPEISFSSSILNFGTVLIGEKADTILRIYNTGMDTLVIHQLFNDEAVFSTDYNPADNIILPGDSISITVTFTPVDTVPVIDTIHIYNNDQDSIVKLTGTGQLPTGIFDLSNVIPQEYLLGPPYPNPFSSYTTFEIDLPRQSFIILTVYNMFGEEVNTIISKELAAGRYKYVWNAGNLASGTYLLKLQSGEFNEVRKIVILR